MKSRFLIVLIAVGALGSGVLLVRAQDQDAEVRGAFLSSRPKTTNTNAPPRRHRPSRKTNTNANSSGAANANTGAVNANSGNNNTSSVKVPLQALGLGYTLFMRGANGRSVRVDPGREFHNGDGVRISLEPNIDGYLYIFHTEGDGAPEMIYPDPRLDGGDNFVEAHVPMEVPSSDESDERLRWFTFYGNPGVERLYVVMTRAPLSAVPTSDELVAICATNKDKCPWRPTPDVWRQIQDATRADVKVVSSRNFGQAETEKEQVATTRGLGLDQNAPEPSVIRMNAQTTAPVLVTVLDLVHK